MCGIAGYVGAPAPELLAAMLSSLEHRGPDDVGSHEAPGVGLGATRLAIIDLAGGGQPIPNEDRSLWIVFNGEIYNHRDLRPDLEARGHRFRSRSDTEVVLHLFEELGERCVEPLRGMFAFAIWNAQRRELVLGRDRLGKKPLYYWQDGGLFLFASEPKALLRHPAVARTLDPAAFHHYLAFGYTPPERSIFAGIAKLPPGHTAILRDGVLTARRYWALPAGDRLEPAPIAPDEAAARVRQELREAVRLRLESDVPVGVFLSGGIDSSVVVASLREVTGQRVATFSIGVPGAASYDELPFARLVAERFDTDHHEEVVEPKSAADLLTAIVQSFDEPFANSSAIPTFIVARATARHVKVVLSGVGGDETFGGYPRYLGVRLSEHYTRVPRWLRRPVGAAVCRLLPESDGSRNWGDWARRFVGGVERPMPDRYIAWTRFFDEATLDRLTSPALRARCAADVEALPRAAYAARGHGDAMDGAIRIDLATYLPHDLLVLADRMSMAHSLELRAPFCDHRVVETALAIAPGLRIPGFRLKGLLKQAYADVLPRPVLTRRKHGFMIPLGRWLRTDLRPVMDELLTPDRVRARGLLVPAAVETLKREHLEGRRGHAHRLFTLMVTELWMREYLDGSTIWRL
jgi:asparagine synthase (glutamine-hydrolysing)